MKILTLLFFSTFVFATDGLTSKAMCALSLLPLGTKTAKSLTAIDKDVKAAKRVMAQLDTAVWEHAGSEGVSGTMIEDPMLLKGQVIVGLELKATGHTTSITVFGGKVIDIAVSFQDQHASPTYTAHLETPSGPQEVILSPGARFVHILRSG